MATRSLKEGASTVGQTIRAYRKARGVTQKQFAVELGVEARTLRMYENGERALENISDLRRIADLLGIDPVELGLAARPPVIAGAEQISAVVEQVASLIHQARLVEAHTTSETLLRDLQRQGKRDDPLFLRALASVHCIAGHVQTITRKTRECAQMIHQYQEMEKIARELADQPLLALALAYHGDVLRRRGDVAQAIGYLEKARASCSQVGAVVAGTVALLFGRAHLTNKDAQGFEAEMACAARFGHASETCADATIAQFSLGAVYVEYARGYGRLRKMEQSQHYLHLAQEHLPDNNLWNMVLLAAQAEALVYTGDLPSAMPLLSEVAHLAQMYGHQLLIERLYRLQYYLEDQITLYRRASRTLSDVLHGPVEN